MWPGPRPTFIPSGILIHPAIWIQQVLAENWGGCACFQGSWLSTKHNVTWDKAYLRTKWHLDPSSRLATTDMGPKLGGCCAPFGWGEELGSHLTQCGLGWSLPAYQMASWSLHPSSCLATWAKKWGMLCPLFWGSGVPINRMSCGMRPTSVPSGILIHRAAWHNKHGPKMGGCAPFREGELGPNLTQSGLVRGLPPCQVSSWSIQPFGHNTPTSLTPT